MSPYRESSAPIAVVKKSPRSWLHYVRTYWRKVAVARAPKYTCFECRLDAHWRTSWVVTSVRYATQIVELPASTLYLCHECSGSKRAAGFVHSMTITPRMAKRPTINGGGYPPRGGWAWNVLRWKLRRELRREYPPPTGRPPGVH